MNNLQIIEMIRLQKQMNDNTNGINWLHGITNKQRDVNWPRSIYGEAFEMMDSTPWKHWKDINGESNMENAQMELIDIWHFLISYGIHSCFMFNLNIKKRDLMSLATVKTLSNDGMQTDVSFDKEKYNELLEISGFSDLLSTGLVNNEDMYNRFFSECVESDLVSLIEKSLEFNAHKEKSFYLKCDTLVSVASSASMYEEQSCSKGDEYRYYATKLQYFNSMLSLFNSILQDDIPADVPRLYLGKNILNQFRQDHGYKEGTYIKIWKNVEDNVHLAAIIKDLNEEDLTFSNIYGSLKGIYETL